MTIRVGTRGSALALAQTRALAARFAGEVEIVEALGELTVLYFKPDGREKAMLAKLPGIHSDLRGRDVSLVADPANVHLFHDGRSLHYR